MKEKPFGYDGQFAVFDTVDKVWVGDNKGVVTYDDWDVARMAGAIINEQMGYSTRFRAAVYSKDAKKHAGEMEAIKTPEQAVKDIESRA